MKRKVFLLTRKEEKVALKLQINKSVADALQQLKAAVHQLDRSIELNIDQVCEEAIQKAIKIGRQELAAIQAGK